MLGENMKSTTYIVMILLFIVTSTHAQNARRIKERIGNLTDRIQEELEVTDASVVELRKAKRLVRRALRVLRGEGDIGGGHGGRISNKVLKAVCHIDDDVEFDFNQKVVGTIYASTIEDLEDLCQKKATKAYGSNGSSGLKDVKVHMEYPAGSLLTATCHIDDDIEFDRNQKVIGAIYGSSMESLVNNCQKIAKKNYGSKGSSGIEDMKVFINMRNFSAIQGECHIDDDPDFNFNQLVVGKLIASTYEGLQKKCEEKATRAYGNNGSSGIKNLKGINL
jgi:hypothetical protein